MAGEMNIITPYRPQDWATVRNDSVELAAQAMIVANKDANRYSVNFWRYLAWQALSAVSLESYK